MRCAAAALAVSKTRMEIPYTFVGTDGFTRRVDDLECARSVMADYDIIPIADMGTATRMWQRTVNKVYDRAPLKGAPVYFPNYGLGKSGHVAEATGNGEEVLTTPVYLRESDKYTTKKLTTISALERECGNAYAGWGRDLAGMAIDFTSSAGGGGTPFPPEVKQTNQGEGMFIYRYTCLGYGSYLLICIGGIVETISVPTTVAFDAIQWRINMLADGFGRTDPKEWGTNGKGERAFLVPTIGNETKDFMYLKGQATLFGVPVGYDILKAPFIPSAYYAGGSSAPADMTAVMAQLDKVLTEISDLDAQDDDYHQKTMLLLGGVKTDIAAVPGAVVKAEGNALSNG